MKRIFREYWVEFVALLIVGIGVFLVFVESNIRDILIAIVMRLITLFNMLVVYIVSNIAQFIVHFSFNDLLGAFLLVGAMIFLLWRGRYHFNHSAFWNAVICPKCGSDLHRIHRSRFDRFLSATLLPGARRYRCKNPDCRWSGLKHRRESDRHHHKHHDPAEFI